MTNERNLNEKFESICCRKDDKARRVLNVAVGTLANITADTLESGVTLESLETLNVPVFRYGTQITIHGNLPRFSDSSRPGGYKSVFLNANGSLGVRYSAIDGGKKDMLARACDVGKIGWLASRSSSGFEVSQSFYVSDEATRDDQKAACLAAMRSIPAGGFFGGVTAGCLAYGSGYFCAAFIGAIPINELWGVIEFFSGIRSESALVQRESDRDRKRAEERAIREADGDAKRLRMEAEAAIAEKEFSAWLQGNAEPRLKTLRRQACSFRRFYAKEAETPGAWKSAVFTIAKRGVSLCCQRSTAFFPDKWHKIEEKHWEAWQAAAGRGELFPA